MKPRILNYRASATHERIASLSSMRDALSISDFHAFVLDPNFESDVMSTEIVFRRRNELRELLAKKGGIVIYFIRPNDWQIGMGGPIGIFGRYSLLQGISDRIYSIFSNGVRSGAGTSITMRPANGPTLAFLQVVRRNLQFEAFLDVTESVVVESSGVVFAVNSVGHPVSVEFRVGEGVLSFVPLVQNVPGDRLGAAIVNAVNAHFNKETEIEIPTWAEQINIPGAQAYDAMISELSADRERLTNQIADLEVKRSETTNYLRLLFGYGKAVLEPQARAAFRLIGFKVREPDEYDGEWDVDLSETESGRTALGEVEGSEGPIDVGKFRQLLDYIQAEAVEGRDHKGLLVGNGFRLTPLDSAERQRQFTDHAFRGAAKFQFCLVPTSELFKAVCAVLESPADESLKARIRESLLNTVGSWSFARNDRVPATLSAVQESTA